MRRAAIGVAATALVAATIVIVPSVSNAAGGTGVWGDWTVTPGSGTGQVTFTGTVFPSATIASTGQSLSVSSGSSVFLPSSRAPIATEYGSSQNRPYLSAGFSSSPATVTLTFTTPPTAGTWAFALGDVDAEKVEITAQDASGTYLDVSAWFQASFNYAGASDLPVWSEPTLTGNNADSSGASAWFKPTQAVKTLTFTQSKLPVGGIPQYQLWIAADVLTATPTASASPSASATPSATASPSASASTSASPSATASATASASATPTSTATTPATLCPATLTRLVNGGFEEPVIPARSFRQLPDADVPGWTTTAADGKIEIWSSGYLNVSAAEGNQFAEINATTDAELYQEVATAPGQELTWSLLHRARGGAAIGDTMSANIGPAGGAPTSSTTFTDTLSAGWVRHSGTYVVPKGQTLTRFGFASGPTASGSKSIGNFLDDIYFTRTVCLPPNALKPGPTASPTPSPTASPTASPTVSGSATPTPSATGATPTAGPGASPTATPTVPPSGISPTSIITPPRRPVVIPVVDSTDPPGTDITDVRQPDHGTATIKDDTVVYTPDPGFIGTDRVTVEVTAKDGTVKEVTFEVLVGLQQQPVQPVTLPATLQPGVNVILSTPIRTNAGQTVQVSALCAGRARVTAFGDVSLCQVTRSGGRTTLTVASGMPVGVRVTLSAPATGRYLPYRQTRTYLVR